MKEFIDKLIEELEGVKSIVNSPADIVWNNAVKMCIYKANELSEEYKGGWIACSERLPKDRQEKLVYLSSNRMTIAKYNEHRLPHSNCPMGWGYDSKSGYIDFENEAVVAWYNFPLPAPYTEGE